MADMFSALAALASAVAGIAAAVAAFRSARSAEEAKRLTESVELRSVLREVSRVVAEAKAEYQRIRALSTRYELASRRNAVATGALGGSRQVLLEQRLLQQVESADSFAALSDPFAGGTDTLANSTSEDANRVLHNQQVALAQLKAISTMLVEELGHIEAQAMQYLQSQLTTPGPK